MALPWGGLYAASNTPTGMMVQDDTRSYCGTPACGVGWASGATLTPAWSGWSAAMNPGQVALRASFRDDAL